MQDLDDLIALEEVKPQISDLVDRIEAGQDDNGPVRLPNLVFAGSPGTGKSTVAGILGQMLARSGVLSSGKLVEVGMPELIGQYVGQGGENVKRVVEQARGGVLLLDEVFSVLSVSGTPGHGDEVLRELVSQMDTERPDGPLVILTGYSDQVTALLQENPGLAARFATLIEFPDYTVGELTEIVLSLANDSGVTLTSEAKKAVSDWISGHEYLSSNGRLARDLWHRIVTTQRVRTLKGSSGSASVVELEDVEAAREAAEGRTPS